MRRADWSARQSIGFGAQLRTSRFAQENTKSTFFSRASPSYLDQVEPSDLIAYGLIPEFVGRLPVLASLQALTEDDLLRVLTEPKNALVTQYESLFALSGIECRFTTPGLREVAKRALVKQTGARGLRRIMESLLLDPFFDAPQSNIKYVLITGAVARENGQAPLYFTQSQKVRLSLSC
jgi:ATP-dependent Clp protease ATP-binding subunit ClpX